MHVTQIMTKIHKWKILLCFLLVSANAPLGISTNTVTRMEAMTAQCNITKSCFGVTNNCIMRDACTAAVTVVRNKNVYEFEMLTKSGVYVAVGISDDDRMGNDAIAACVKRSDAVGVALTLSRTKRYSNIPIHTSLRENGVTLLDSSIANGSIYCKFQREPLINIAETTAIDLKNKEYHLLIAYGTSLGPDDSIAQHTARRGSTHAQYLHDIGMFDGYAVATAPKLHVLALLLPCQLLYILYRCFA